MPMIRRSTYRKRPFLLFNAHLETIVPSIMAKVGNVSYVRERIELDDGDFLDLDWLSKKNSKLMIISHGLEGNSDRFYVRRTANYFHSRGWDILAWNCRSCGGEMNRLPRFYHHGDTHDLEKVIEHSLSFDYQQVVLFGFSMGGSMSLKYLGERSNIDERIKGAVTFSVPCNLEDSGEQLKVKSNRIYEKRFLEKLKAKIKLKALEHPNVISSKGIDLLEDFESFHERYTVPLHGFESLQDFYDQSTCDQFLKHIKLPVFIGNAMNDPMLGIKCYPTAEAQNSKFIHLDMPSFGGHIGFSYWGKSYSWMEVRGEEFIKEVID